MNGAALTEAGEPVAIILWPVLKWDRKTYLSLSLSSSLSLSLTQYQQYQQQQQQQQRPEIISVSCLNEINFGGTMTLFRQPTHWNKT